MIVDTSALLAILYREADAERYEQLIAATPNCRMSVANALEASIVLEGRGGTEAGLELNAFLESAGIELAPVTLAQLAAARRARRRFGKGNHPAALNFGNCFSHHNRRTLAVQGRRLLPYRHPDGIGVGRRTRPVRPARLFDWLPLDCLPPQAHAHSTIVRDEVHPSNGTALLEPAAA